MILCLCAVAAFYGSYTLYTVPRQASELWTDNYRSVQLVQDLRYRTARVNVTWFSRSADGLDEAQRTQLGEDLQSMVDLTRELRENSHTPEEEVAATTLEATVTAFTRDYLRMAAGLEQEQAAEIRDRIAQTTLDLSSQGRTIVEINEALMLETLARVDQRTRWAGAILGAALLVILLLTSLFLLQMWGKILRPLTGLRDQLKKTRHGSSPDPLELEQEGYLGDLVQPLNAILASAGTHGQEQELRVQRLRGMIDSTLESLPHPVFVTDLQGDVQFQNAAARDLTEQMEMSGRVPRDLRPHLREILRRSPSESPPGDTAGEVIFSNRGCRFQCRFLPIREGAEVAGALLLMQDVTEQHRGEEARGNIIGTLSHQVKTPMTGLRLALELLMKNRSHLSRRDIDLVEMAMNETENLLLNLNDLIDLNEVDDSSGSLSFAPASADRLLQTARTNVLPEARGRDIKVVVQADTDLPTVELDRDRILHVLESLLLNAVRASPSNSTIHLSAEHQPESGAMAFIIRDEATCVTEDQQLCVMDRFLTDDPGNGGSEETLGFFVVRQIVFTHGGRIKMFQRRSHGCDVEVHLPLRQVREDPVPQGPETETGSHRPSPLTRRLRGRITPNL